MQTISELQQKFNDFVDLKTINNVLIVADDDEDGYTSALQLKRFLENNNCAIKVVFNDKSDLTKEKFVKAVSGFEYELVFFVDLNEEIVSMYSNVIKRKIKIVDIDHHPSPDKTNVVNPLLVLKSRFYSEKKPSQRSATKVVYDLFGGNDLLASIGLIGDSAYSEWKEFIDETIIKYKTDFKTLAAIGDLIKCVANLHETRKNELFDFLYDNIDIDKIIMDTEASPDLINQEIKKLLEGGLIYEPRPGRLRYLG